jgi:selenocysteine lyase/cysteine desulfurase
MRMCNIWQLTVGSNDNLQTIITDQAAHYIRIKEYLTKTNVQVGATYAVGKEASNVYYKAYKAAAAFVNASEDEVG